MKKLTFCLILLLSALPAKGAVAHTQSAFGLCGNGTFSGNMSAGCAGPALTTTFTFTATAANRAVFFGIFCGGTSEASVTLTASGWTITALSTPVSSSNGSLASFGAIAPNTSAATFTLTWATDCANAMADYVEEFSGNDTTGGTTTFEGANKATNSGNCTVQVTPVSNNDGLAGVCIDSVTAVGSGFTKGADDTVGDWSEWKILSGGASVAQTVDFTGSGVYDIVAVAIKPGSAAAAPNRPPAVI